MGSTGTLLADVSTFTAGPGRPGNAALFVMAVDRADGSGIARLVNFACPATILGNSTQWTADYPGYAAWAIEQSSAPLWLVATVIFVTTWVVQFVGHNIEGAKPSFFDDVLYLLIGPAFLADKVRRGKFID